MHLAMVSSTFGQVDIVAIYCGILSNSEYQANVSEQLIYSKLFIELLGSGSSFLLQPSVILNKKICEYTYSRLFRDSRYHDEPTSFTALLHQARHANDLATGLVFSECSGKSSFLPRKFKLWGHCRLLPIR